jgi:hypothetical protein
VGKTLKDLKVSPIELTREQRIKQVAYLIVTGELLNTEQSISIILSLGLLEMALVLQKRRRLGKKDAKGTESGVCDGVTGVGPLWAMVRQLSEPSVHEGLEVIEA